MRSLKDVASIITISIMVGSVVGSMVGMLSPFAAASIRRPIKHHENPANDVGVPETVEISLTWQTKDGGESVLYATEGMAQKAFAEVMKENPKQTIDLRVFSRPSGIVLYFGKIRNGKWPYERPEWFKPLEPK